MVSHELGHWANNNVIKQIVQDLLRVYLMFIGFSFSFQHTDMPKDFGFDTDESNVLHLLLYFIVLEPILEAFDFQKNALSRSMEFKADRYAVDLGYGKYLKSGLIAAHVNNHSNLNPDWLYALFKFSHPALIERLNEIDKAIIEIAQKEDPKNKAKVLKNSSSYN